ncbi:MAG TPA: cupin domain-containing protein [Anaerolineales bacterium]|nr:cupin domain-containing protein [Anaerolineales bacterium]HNC08498.1 cupin domain-containing protein [Anaerolineales bacterium]
MPLPRLADLNAGEWQEHARFPGIYWKNLLTTEDNPLANVNIVQVPSGGVIGRHHHTQQVETIWVVSGCAILTLDQTDIPIRNGQIIAIPIGLEHALRNEGQVTVQLLTFFTPPLI